ncbi:MAG: hypothetical protein ACOX0F_13725 [Syntrophomonadaceae bacterium]|jgi:hypothetical protein
MQASLHINYLALAAALIKGWDPDKAINKADGVAYTSNNKYTREDIEKMAELRRQGLSYEEVGAV